MDTIEEIRQEVKSRQSFDFEGDPTYRVHIGIAIELINRAYKLGLSEGKSSVDLMRSIRDNIPRVEEPD